jgi:hypothetical protein
MDLVQPQSNNASQPSITDALRMDIRPAFTTKRLIATVLVATME